MKALIRLIFRALLFVVIGVLVYSMGAFLLSFFSTQPQQFSCEKKITVYVASNGVHLDIIVPIERLNGTEMRQISTPVSTQFIAFGWGDKDFYVNTPTWGEMSFWVTFKALFLPTESIMHLTFYRQKLGHWKPIDLCPLQLEKLQVFLESSFVRDENGAYIELAQSGYTSMDTFFKANGKYSIFNTCNDWVNRGLKASMVKTAIWSPFDFGVLSHL